MLSSFYKKFSLNNLKKDKPLGQIATLLILMIVVVLALILTTVNLGLLSVTTTKISNTADTASLFLASQIASKANAMYQSLGGIKQCKNGGMAGIVFAIVAAVLVVVTIAMFWNPVGWSSGAILAVYVGAGAAAGAIGGAIGASYAGTSVLAGAIQGFMIGAAIGGAAAPVPTGPPIPLDSAEGMEAVAAGGQITLGAEGTSTVQILAVSVPSLSLAAVGTAASLYNASVAEQNTSAAFAAAAKSLSGLPEYDRIRESVFLQALTQVVDDPNKYKDGDPRDLNGDGDITDKIPNFYYWWDDRVNTLKSILPGLKSLVSGFFQGTLVDFKDYAQSEYAATTRTYEDEGSTTTTTTPALLSRQEIDTLDGPVVALARALKNAGIDISFWKPGTPPDCACETCGENYYDELQAVVCRLKDMVTLVTALSGLDNDQLTMTWQTWVTQFYDPESEWTPANTTANADWYDVLKNGIEPKLQAWKDEIENIRKNKLPTCQIIQGYNYNDDGGVSAYDYIANPPCRSNPADSNSYPSFNPNFLGSTNEDLNDEFTQAYQAIDNLIAGFQSFRSKIEQFYNAMQAQYGPLTNWGGLNPATYSWADTRSPCHSVAVEVSPFKLPSTISTSSGSFLKKEYCIELINYHDEGARTWVKITRQDGHDKEIKSGKVALGIWNPFFSGIITKKGKAYYSYDKVGLTQW